MTRPINLKNVPEAEQPLSEQFRIVAAWADVPMLPPRCLKSLKVVI
jgi:hypothetical protein